MKRYYSEYSKFFVSVDCIIFGFEDGELRILIGRRNMDPGRGENTIYGGFVDEKESVDDAAVRVLYELTGLEGIYMQQVGAFGKVDRDPGARVVTVAYYALIKTSDYDPTLAAKHNVRWVSVNDIPPMFGDHNRIVQQARQEMRMKLAKEPVGFRLLPELFTLTQLQKLYEAVNGCEMDKRNFRKHVKEMPYIEKTEHVDKKCSKRGACLYKFNEQKFNEMEHKFRM